MSWEDDLSLTIAKVDLLHWIGFYQSTGASTHREAKVCYVDVEVGGFSADWQGCINDAEFAGCEAGCLLINNALVISGKLYVLNIQVTDRCIYRYLCKDGTEIDLNDCGGNPICPPLDFRSIPSARPLPLL